MIKVTTLRHCGHIILPLVFPLSGGNKSYGDFAALRLGGKKLLTTVKYPR